MEREVATCSYPEDHRYVVLDVARRRAGVDPADVEAGRAGEVDIDVVEGLLDFYNNLDTLRWTIHNVLFRRPSSRGA